MENEADHPDVIRDQMTETRTALSEKLEALEQTVVSAVQGTTDTVTETVQNVKDAVEDTVSTVKETVSDTVDSVKASLDIGQHVENHPWLMFGGAVLLGYVGGRYLHSSTPNRTAPATPRGYNASMPMSSYSAPTAPPPSAPSPQGGLLSGLMNSLNPVFQRLGGVAVGALTGIAGEMVMSAAPEPFKAHIKDVVGEVNKALGGENIDLDGFLSQLANPSSDNNGASQPPPGPTANPQPHRAPQYR